MLLKNYVNFIQGGNLDAKNSQIWISAFDYKYITVFYEDNKQQDRLIHLISKVSSTSGCRYVLIAKEYIMHRNNLWTQYFLNDL